MSASSSERIVVCPRCQGDSVYSERNPARPFCSERCKNLDFSAWASENYRIESRPSAEDDPSDESPPEIAGTTGTRH